MTSRTVCAAIGAIFLMAACGSSNKAKTTPQPVDTANDDAGKSSNVAKAKRKEVAQGELRDVLLLLKRVHFAFDTNELTDDSRTALTEAADKLKRLPKVHLYVDGHTDERGTPEYNIGLGERRAKAVNDYLTNLGVSGDRLHSISFGEEQPLATGETPVANAKNRRVDFRLMRGDVEFVLEESQLVDDAGKPMSMNGKPLEN